MSGGTVLILTMGRQQGFGEHRRVAAWEAMLGAAGVATERIGLLDAHRAGVAPARWPSVGSLLKGDTVAESLVWDARGVAADVARRRPAAVICITARTYHPRLHDAAGTVVVDFVDRMSENYRIRAELAPLVRRPLFLALAGLTRRSEASAATHRGPRVAAGRRDAEVLDADWLPNVVSAGTPVDAAKADHDLLFFGTLSYAPNVEAVERLAHLWPRIVARRPATTALVAGANPTPEVRSMAAERGWTLEPWFDSVDAICRRGRIGVIPMARATGIQNKLLDAAALALPQVVTPAVVDGVDPDFPVEVGNRDDELVSAMLALLDAPDRARALGLAARAHVAARYAPEVWADRAAALVDPS